MESPLPADLHDRACLEDEEVRHLCERAAELERLEGTPQDVEWAIERSLPFPDSVFFLQHRPVTTSSAELPAPKPYDPVQYALQNVFKVGGS